MSPGTGMNCFWLFSTGSIKPQGCQTAFDSAEARTSRQSGLAEGGPGAGEGKSAAAARAGEGGGREAEGGVFREGSEAGRGTNLMVGYVL